MLNVQCQRKYVNLISHVILIGLSDLDIWQVIFKFLGANVKSPEARFLLRVEILDAFYFWKNIIFIVCFCNITIIKAGSFSYCLGFIDIGRAHLYLRPSQWEMTFRNGLGDASSSTSLLFLISTAAPRAKVSQASTVALANVAFELTVGISIANSKLTSALYTLFMKKHRFWLHFYLPTDAIHYWLCLRNFY